MLCVIAPITEQVQSVQRGIKILGNPYKFDCLTNTDYTHKYEQTFIATTIITKSQAVGAKHCF